ncbi:uncharacterized protein LOC126384729 isoform X1 [Epinephelus moara]|uniref:uncharacterized protein LOC126384729 isoform X1 n=1 Tax=Epinephelus moara TaxID=300413 RepID=UPI00214EB641|nr:uncharacterized protein LOC126384729 isoform X1 [Epinephelus moara]XP_049891937.1 uncharacterized protein LOC126384729 isoform X1 [Epinephelus moara]XP_049891944.1 uncharacterized protein LOC126384729 isoform X1 [Epinephelus moara]XP_049891952.1 uncharacterized protein LOC126384729 isoform X1 [Epinephelus moara]XP_049891962.1 uncharacterized protein LOC126384729 isoform X1 [Epinephelus moara]
MAPACAAGRLSALLGLVFAVVFNIFCQDVSALLVYDRQALIDIKTSHEKLLMFDYGDRTSSPPPFLASIPAYLCRSPVLWKRCSRRRGKRGGVLVRIKAYLRAGLGTNPHRLSNGLSAACWCIGIRWIRPIVPPHLPGILPHSPVEIPLSRRSRVRYGGVNRRNLRALDRAALPGPEEKDLHLALFNARSIANKTFLLNDFFVSRKLDFMFLTETWLHVGESTPLSELLPPGCLFLSSPRLTGRGGGLASVFKSSFQCQQSLPGSFSSFELQTFVLNLTSPILCALVYRPPHLNKDFIQDFGDFLAETTLRYDRVLIVGDFNIHVCCESKPLAREFMNLIDSFNLIQSWLGQRMKKDTHWTLCCHLV